jgi:dienelactone hydrolase
MSAPDATSLPEPAATALGPDRFREPLAGWAAVLRARSGGEGTRAFRFEYSSRGDRVPGLLLLPAEGAGPFPLVLLQHGAGGSKEADSLDAARLPWVRRGLAVASIDFPLHGERASAKLTELLLAALAQPPAARDADSRALWDDFARQSVHDLARALDALAPHPELDAGRVAYAGFGMGAILGALFCPYEPRLRGAALALGGAGFGPPALDPARHIAGFAGRPLLLLNATRDERIPRAAAEALHAAAGEPKRLLWFESGHSDLPGIALEAIWRFLAETLAP